MPTNHRIKIENGTLISPDGLLPNSSLWMADGLIVGVGDQAIEGGEGREWEKLNAKGMYVAPGFVDVHIHGGAGSDFMDGTLDDTLAICAYHAKGGTTSLLATTATDSIQNILLTIRVVAEARAKKHNGSRILGLHIEGPYFNFEKKGCHLPQYVRNPEPEEYKQLLDFSAEIRRMTLAPELPGAEGLIRALSERGLVPSAGHSNATYLDMVAAIEWGLRHSTHLYCAMSNVVKIGAERRGGIVETSLLLDSITTELIADGVHLPPELMQLAVKCKGTDGVILVTDAQRAAGMPDGEYEFGRRGEGAPFIVKNGVAKTPDGSGYASSTVQMIDTVRVACQKIGVSLSEAVKMASLIPARILGLEKYIGSLEVGKRSDIVLFDEQWRVQETYIDGRKVY